VRSRHEVLRRAFGVLLASIGVGSVTVAGGCEPVPDLHFVSDAGGDTRDDADADRDAATTDAISSEASTSCPTPAPAGDAVCCGSSWCQSGCNASACAECVAKGCRVGEVCCVKPGTVVCQKECSN